VVQEASEQASSADSHWTAHPLRSPIRVQEKWPSNLQTKFNLREAERSPLKANSASAEELRAAVLEATQMLGPLDIFVSNAGILIRGTIDTYSLEDLDRMIAINIRAAFVGVQAAAHLAPRAITINNVQPGPTATEMRVHLMPKS
jgi:NAD(P)-dependent dehydrogenase (short-subunit alcohol dehydrogenase family)